MDCHRPCLAFASFDGMVRASEERVTSAETTAAASSDALAALLHVLEEALRSTCRSD